MKKFMIFLAAVLISYIASANNYNPYQDPYYEIRDINVEKIEDSEWIDTSDTNSTTSMKKSNSIGEVIAVGREIIAFGKEIYQIVEAGRPVVNTNYSPVSVLPYNETRGKEISPMNLNRWKGPRSVKYKVTYTNGFGMNVITFIYNINMSYGGSYHNKGYYITNAQIVPEYVSVAWGYSFNASMKLVGITNKGTQDFPIAGATLSLTYEVSTIIQEDRNNLTFFLSGDGTIKSL
jgi:hypothetical protein